MIQVTCSEWLEGRGASRLLVRAFFYTFVSEALAKARTYCPAQYEQQLLTDSWATYSERFQNALKFDYGQNWKLAAVALDNLVDAVNKALARVNFGPIPQLGPYSNVANDCWNDVGAALRAMEALVANGLPALAPEDGNMPNIPGARWSVAKDQLPVSLRDLIRDIHARWKVGTYLDRRTAAQVLARTVTSDIPGALRSWHMNVLGSLPAMGNVATPANAQNLHTHYTNTSGVMNALGVAPAGPIGYAEYTGTGIRADVHNSKIVLDYKRGRVFLTVSHYQLWDQGAPYVARGQDAGSGAFSPWFYFDMGA